MPNSRTARQKTPDNRKAPLAHPFHKMNRKLNEAKIAWRPAMSTRESSPAKPLEIPNEPSHVRYSISGPSPESVTF